MQELATVKVRYKSLDGEESLLAHVVEPVENANPSRDFRTTVSAATIGEILSKSDMLNGPISGAIVGGLLGFRGKHVYSFNTSYCLLPLKHHR